MSFVSVTSFLATPLLLLFSNYRFCNVVDGKIWYDDDGAQVSGENLIGICSQTQKCDTHFGKNVYATSRPVLDHEWTPLLLPEMYDQFDSESECGSGSKFISMDTCAAIHSPMTPYHPEGEISVSYVEEQYSLKWKNIRESDTPIYDSFLDNTAAYWVDDLTKYYDLWNEVGADIVILRWYVKDTNNALGNTDITSKTYYSLITHNGDATTGSTLTQYELISDTFSGITDDIISNKIIDSEQRAFFDELTDFQSFGVGCDQVPIGARRAVTNVDENVAWYKKIFAASIDVDKQIIQDTFIDYNGNVVKYAHIKLYPLPHAVTVSFFERDSTTPDISTYGDFSVQDFENAMTDTHNENMLNPYCGIDRWFDMHFAIDFGDTETSEKIFNVLMNSGEKYTVFSEYDATDPDALLPAFVYMAEPNGHSVQMVFDIESSLEFLTWPANWNSNWCPLECTDDMMEYEFGDQIAIITIDNEENDDNNKDAFVAADGGRDIQNKPSIFSVLYIFLGIFGVLLIGSLIICLSKHCDTFKYEKIPQ